jgi:hypothetical protein
MARIYAAPVIVISMEYTRENNRRKHPRVRDALIVSVVLLDSRGADTSHGKQIECHTKDVSFQGLCLLSDVEIAPDSKLELIISIEDQHRTFAFEGIVMWCKFNTAFQTYETGIQFQDIDEIPGEWKMLVINLLTGSFNQSMTG